MSTQTTAPATQQPEARPSPVRRALSWCATPGGLAALFVVGFAIRIVLARGGGFPFDMSSFAAWSSRLADLSPWNFYPDGAEEFFVDYPPGYLYVLWIVGLIADVLLDGPPSVFWLKLPPILADLGLAWLVMVAAERLAPPTVTRRFPVRPVAAAAILLNPAIFFISAVWGQADSFPAVLVVGGLLLLGTGVPTFRREAAGIALLAFAVGTKPQTGFVVPVVVLLVIWRHVRGRVDAADDAHGRRRAAWLGSLRVAALGATGVVSGFLLFAPFRLDPVRAFDFYMHSSRTYPVTSVFAFNLWGAVGFWRPDSGSDAVRVLGVPAVFWGIGLFVAIGAIVLGRAWSSLRDGNDEGRVLVFGAIALTLVAFAVVTRIHERYLFVPIVLVAMLTGTRWMRRALVALSAAYLINVFFPYVYYLEFVDRPAPKLGGAFDAFYGTDIGGIRLKLLSVAITAICLLIAARGWRGIEVVPTEAAVAVRGEPGEPPGEDVIKRPPWALQLHPISRWRVLIALGVFALALLSRMAGLGHPPGMYFDEVYHARTGAEYLGNKEVFEYTHPPFAKEVMGFSIQHLSGIDTQAGGPLPGGTGTALVAPRRNGVVWVRGDGGVSRVQLGRIDDDCAPETQSTLFRSEMRADQVATTDTAVLLAGTGDGGPVLSRIEGQTETWQTALPGRAVGLAMVGERAFIVTDRGDLVAVSPEGDPETLAIGATAVSASGPDKEAWVAFGDQRRIAVWDEGGRRDAVIETEGEPSAIAVAPGSERVFATVGDAIVSYDTESKAVHSRVAGPATILAAVPETTAVWAISGTEARVIEPHSAVVIGRTNFERAPESVTADPVRHRLLAVTENTLQCASAHPQWAWRLGSALMGAAMVGLVFLLALRLFGNLLAALLASLFLAVDGLAFTIGRIAMNDSYATAFVLATWFCVLSALRTREPRDGPSPVVWLALGGVFAGLGLASKWVALYALAGIGLLLIWDGFVRRERSIWHVGGDVRVGIAIVGALLGILPLAIYTLTYVPYFSLGHGVGEFLRLQEDMFSYHSTLTATHPFGSPWYGWPFGYRSVFLYLDGSGSTRSEIWTIPNLVVFWGGLVALAALANRARRLRSVALGVVVLAAAVQYLPWTAITRVTFMYHYLPVVPFLAIALGWWLAVGLGGWRYRHAATIAISTAAIAMFLVLYPMLVGWEMPVAYLEGVRNALPWVIP